MKHVRIVLAGAALAAFSSCSPSRPPATDNPASADTPAAVAPAGTFAADLAFLRKHTKMVVLSKGEAQVAIAPGFQARVMTSTTGGPDGPSFGWLNYKLIEKGIQPKEARQGQLEDHIHPFGGEERFWLGPEGGQFALFFAPGSKFEFADWHTPPLLDTEAFDLVESSAERALFQKDFELVNYHGTRFIGRIERTIRLLDAAEVGQALGLEPGHRVQVVGYESDNRLTNQGPEAWTPEKGLLSIWILGMFNPSAETTIVVPFKPGPDSELGPKVNAAYFGEVPPEHLAVKDGAVFFKGDGTRRGKIGLSAKRALGLAGSYAADAGRLTLVTYNPAEAPHGYVNSMWELQDEPYGGDVLNAYNDGPVNPGEPPMGPFYELETSSPAAALAPEQTLRHVQRTLHLRGPKEDLDRIARAVLGVGLDDIASAFAP